MNKDFIQEELEKEIKFHHNCINFKNKNDKCDEFNIAEAKLSQHLATKQAMIKEFDEMEFGFTEFQDKCPICKKENKFWDYKTNPSICLRCSLKQKLGELK